MTSLIDEGGQYRNSGVGGMSDDRVMHMAPPENQVHRLMGDHLNWLAEGNERMGHVWQTLILSLWNLIFLNILVESLI